ncbi:MAG: hypothetical protein ABEJ30_06740 [Halorientalis sp.]
MAFDALAEPGLWLAAMAGGAFGAALGAVPSLALSGLLVVAGEALAAVNANLPTPGSGSAGQLGSGVTQALALGPVLGPHVAFAGGAAAAAYAARKGYTDSVFQYHEAKNVYQGLGTRPDVLAVGAAVGALGFALRHVSGGLGLPFDPVFAALLVTGLVHRVALGFPVLGQVRGEGYLDMTPFERGERRHPPAGSERVYDPEEDEEGVLLTRLAVEPWLAHQYEWASVAAVGLVAGVLGAYTAVVTNSAFLAFGFSAASLLLLAADAGDVPVTHHVTLPASTAALAVMAPGNAVLAGAGPLVAIVVGTLVGLVSALAAEAFQRVGYAHGDTHWDPAAAGIVVGTLLVALAAMAGLFASAVWIPVP